jgi:hypothetical protein
MSNTKSKEREKIIKAALQRYSEGMSTEEEREILIESMKRYREEAKKRGRGIPYNALILRYFVDNPQTFSQVAARLLCTRRTVFKYLVSGYYFLAPHIFGIDGIYLVAPDDKPEEHDKQRRNYANTKQLLENYRTLRSYIQGNNIDVGPETRNPLEILEGSDGFTLSDDILSFEMIKQHQQRTKIILDYIDNAVLEYRSSCERAGTEDAQRRYRIFMAYYLDKEALPIDQIMEREHVKQRTVYRDIKKAIGKLACRIYTPRQHDQEKRGGEEDGVLSNCRI